MEKVLGRAKYAEKQVTKRIAKRKAYLEHTEDWSRKQNTQRLVRVFNQNLVTARKNRKVDWQLGPLAPRRDVGEKASTYGAFSVYDFQHPDVGPQAEKGFFPVTEGDRVVMMKGRDKGKIAEVADVQKEKRTVRVTGLNVVDVEIPAFMAGEVGTDNPINPIARHARVEHVRLVYPLPDPESGVPRDVVIDRLDYIRRRKVNDDDNEFERFIPGTNTIIPWPEKAEPDYETFESDTAAISLDDRSFRPYLLAAPMPISVIDELRNKYSKFRTRHDAEYIEKKEAQAEREERRKGLAKTMRTPLQELAEVRAKQKKAAERELSDEQLARIGEVIEKEEMKAMGTVGGMSSPR